MSKIFLYLEPQLINTQLNTYYINKYINLFNYFHLLDILLTNTHAVSALLIKTKGILKYCYKFYIPHFVKPKKKKKEYIACDGFR